MAISIDVENRFDKIQHSFVIKTQQIAYRRNVLVLTAVRQVKEMKVMQIGRNVIVTIYR